MQEKIVDFQNFNVSLRSTQDDFAHEYQNEHHTEHGYHHGQIWL